VGSRALVEQSFAHMDLEPAARRPMFGHVRALFGPGTHSDNYHTYCINQTRLYLSTKDKRPAQRQWQSFRPLAGEISRNLAELIDRWVEQSSGVPDRDTGLNSGVIEAHLVVIQQDHPLPPRSHLIRIRTTWLKRRISTTGHS